MAGQGKTERSVLDKVKLSESGEELKEALTEVCIAFGYAMRHTNINHKTKSEEGWEYFADRLARFAEAAARVLGVDLVWDADDARPGGDA